MKIDIYHLTMTAWTNLPQKGNGELTIKGIYISLRSHCSVLQVSDFLNEIKLNECWGSIEWISDRLLIND